MTFERGTRLAYVGDIEFLHGAEWTVISAERPPIAGTIPCSRVQGGAQIVCAWIDAGDLRVIDDQPRGALICEGCASAAKTAVTFQAYREGTE